MAKSNSQLLERAYGIAESFFIAMMNAKSLGNHSKTIQTKKYKINCTNSLKQFCKLCFGVKKMTNEQIRDFYDQNLNMTLKELSQITGLSIAKLKTILMGV